MSNFSNFPASHKAIKAKLWRFKEGKNKETNGNFLYDQVIPKEIGQAPYEPATINASYLRLG